MLPFSAISVCVCVCVCVCVSVCVCVCVCVCVSYTGGGGRGETDNWSRCQRVTSLVRSLNFQVPRNTWLGVNNGWSNISYYYCKCCVTAGWGSKGQIPHQIINASSRAKTESEGGSEGVRRRES